MRKKIISILLSVLMLSMTFTVPMQANGQENTVNTDTENVEISNNELSVKGSNSVGSLISDVIEAKVQEQEENNGYNIFSVEVTDKQADVSFEIVDDCTLVVGIYDESGQKMLASGYILLFEGETQKTVEIETAGMPEYFYLRAFLVDSDEFTPLCTAYETPNYTREMQQFFDMSTDDFDEERVLNFDDDKINNFAVYGEDTNVIEQDENVNQFVVADEENDIYVIENADDRIKSLNDGEILAYEYDNGEVLIIKVDSISVDDTTVSITGADTTLEEVFECVKLSGNESTENAYIDASDLEDGIVYEGLVESEPETESRTYSLRSSLSGGEKWTQHYGVDRTIGSGTETAKLTGSLDFEISASIELNVTWNYQYLELKIDYGASLKINFEGKSEGEIPLALIGISPVPGVYIELTPTFVLKVDITVTLDGKIGGTVGFQAVAGDKINNITTKPKFTSKIDASGTLYIGIKIKPRIKIISEHLAEANINAQVGIKAIAKPAEKTNVAGTKHLCKLCIDGEVLFTATLSFEAKFFNSFKLTFNAFNVEEHMLDFYYSIDKGQFGWTKCPDIKNDTYIRITDESGNPIAGAVITAPFSIVEANGNVKEVSSLTTDDYGKVTGYLSSGKLTITIAKAGYKKVQSQINVKEGRQSIQITLKNKDREVSSGDVLDILCARAYKTLREYDGTMYVVIKVAVYLNINYRPEDTQLFCSTDICDTASNFMGTGTTSISIGYAKKLDDTFDKQIEVNVGYIYLSSAGTMDAGSFIPEQAYVFSEKDIEFGEYKEIPITVKAPSLYNTYACAATTYESDEADTHNEKFSGLIPNNIYNYYIMKSRETDDALNSYNLLYIGQAAADDTGNLAVSYEMKEEYGNYDMFVVGMNKKDIETSEVIIEDVTYNGQEQIADIQAFYDGVRLEEGKDYNVTGDYSATDIGTYTITLNGIGDYCGTKTIMYSVLAEEIAYGDTNSDGIIDTQDAVLLKKYLAGYTGLNIDLAACDVNADGEITSTDAVLLLKKLAGYDVVLGEK